MEVSSLCCETEQEASAEFFTTQLLAEQSQTTVCSHQDLEKDHEQLVTGHEVIVEDSQVEPAGQTAKHLDEHLLVVPGLLHTRRLKHSRSISAI